MEATALPALKVALVAVERLEEFLAATTETEGVETNDDI